jgi:hypothetical protein
MKLNQCLLNVRSDGLLVASLKLLLPICTTVTFNILLKPLVIIYLLPLLDFFGVHFSEDEDILAHRFSF